MEEPKRILIVDDNRTIMMVLVKKLSEEGYKILTACNGQEGLDAATRELPDLIISDVDMPVMDGGEMASKLRASSRTRGIPIIFLTSLIDKEEAGRKSSSDTIYMSKLCKAAELLATIRELFASLSK